MFWYSLRHKRENVFHKINDLLGGRELIGITAQPVFHIGIEAHPRSLLVVFTYLTGFRLITISRETSAAV